MIFRDFTCSVIHRRPLGHWPFLLSFDGLRQGFRSVFGSTAVYRCIYSNEQKQSHASDLSDSANQGMAVGATDGLYQCPKLETRTLLCPCIHYISNAHMSVHPHVHKYSKRCTHTFCRNAVYAQILPRIVLWSLIFTFTSSSPLPQC